MAGMLTHLVLPRIFTSLVLCETQITSVFTYFIALGLQTTGCIYDGLFEVGQLELIICITTLP